MASSKVIPMDGGSDEIAKDQLIHFVGEGGSGTDISAGTFDEEYLLKLTSTQAAEEYDEMRRSDDEIKMLMRVIKNPITSASWAIEPVDDSDEEKHIADFIEHVLFKGMGNPFTGKVKTWSEFIREALTFVEFGYSMFEVVHKVVLDDEEFGDYIGIKDLGWRSPKTIWEWNLDDDGSINNVRQITMGDLTRDVNIAGRNLMVLTPHKEGDNYEGISDLRNIYGNWVRKNFYRKAQVIGIERAATGVPMAKIPNGQINSPEHALLKKILKAFVMHQSNYLIVPEGYEITQFKIDHDAEKVDMAIAQENIGMTKSFLANFMELGMSRASSGAYALGSDLSDIFLGGIEFYSDLIKEMVDIRVIRLLVDAKFGKRRNYPKLTVSGIKDKGGKEFAEVLEILDKAGMVQKSDKMMAHVHKAFKLPDFIDDLPDETDAEGKTVVVPDAPKGEENTAEIDMMELAEGDSVPKQVSQGGKKLSEFMEEELRVNGMAFVQKITLVQKNTPPLQVRAKVKDVRLPGKPKYLRDMKEIAASITDGATQQVKSELSLPKSMTFGELEDLGKTREVPRTAIQAAKAQAELLAETQYADIEKNVGFSFNSNLETLNPDQMLEQLTKIVEEYVTGPSVRTAGANTVESLVNTARNAVFQRKEVFETIESFVFTNGAPQAAVCKELAGRVFSKQEYLTTDRLPGLHHGCNSYIVAQQTTEKKPRPISPLGLQYTGTPAQVETIIKSKKF